MSLEVSKHNLPRQITSFIGREKEIAEIEALLINTRLLTLVGSGGSGKTRLALQVAAALLEHFPQGVWFVDFAPLMDSGLVPQTVATVLGVKEESGKPIMETLIEQLKNKRQLLLLDNCEHLLDACAKVADTLIRHCPEVQILASSREALGISGEQTYRVPSLSLPDREQAQTPNALSQCESVQLFIDRCLLVRPDFRLTSQNASALASVCCHLDGIPFAIELAAARVRSLTVEEIDGKLDQRFRLLTGGSRTALPRHQTLRSLIDWSYYLLHDAEQRLLQRLSVFAGGWTLEAAEQICAGDGAQDWVVVDLLTSLSDKCLVVVEQTDGHSRYRLLETVRQYARLAARDGIEATCRSHALYYLRLAEALEESRLSAHWKTSLETFETELGNFRLAYAWALDNGEGELALRMASALWLFFFGSAVAEGKRLVESALSIASPAVAPAVRGKALQMAGLMAFCRGEFVVARDVFKESARLLRDVGDQRYLGRTLAWLASTYSATAPPFEPAIEEALKIGRQTRDEWGLSLALYWRSFKAITRHNLALARPALEELVRIQRSIREPYLFSTSLDCMGGLEELSGNDQAAAAYYAEAMSIARQIDYGGVVGSAAAGLGGVAFRAGDMARSKALFADGLRASYRAGFAPATWRNLRGIALVEAANQEYEWSARLLGAVDALRTSEDVQTHRYYDAVRQSVRERLGGDAFEARLREGSMMNMPEAVACALKLVEPTPENVI